MKTLGLIGGTSWHSTVEYYRIINQKVNEHLGGLNSARILLYSVNFEEFKPPADPAKWGTITSLFIDISNRLVKAGAECIVLCANTPHMVADLVVKEISVPLIHIAEVTAAEIVKQDIGLGGMLGTRFTMEQPFFTRKLSESGISTLIPTDDERDFIHTSIFSELNKGIFKDETRRRFLEIIENLKHRGAGGIIFGCTEIPLLVKKEDCDLPVFDTLIIHAEAAVEFALRA